MRLLVVEDEQDMNTIITKLFLKNNYQVDSCFNGEDAKEHILQCEYDAIILDVMMPKLDGFGLIKWLRDNGNNVPVLMLTARDFVEDKVKGLDLGCDDYLVKPFNIDELLARVRAITRKNTDQKSNIFKCADLEIDVAKRTVKRNNIAINLINKEFSILEYLIRNKGVVITREKLENQIWNFDNFGSSNNIDVYISRLRKKIDNEFEKKLLYTIKGVGWVLKEDE